MRALGVVMLVAVAPGAPSVTVQGNSDCPAPADVSAALVGLVAAPRPPDAPDVVQLLGQGSSVTLRLSNAANVLIAERQLPEAPSCEERARTAAVIVAAWEAHLRAGAAPMWPLPPAVPPPAARSEVPALVAAPPAPPRPLRVETAAAAMASIAAGGVAPAALLEATLSRGDSSFALGLGALAVGAHSAALGSGRGTWRRFGGLVDAQSSASWQTVALQLHAALALTAVSATGESLPVTSGATLFDPGALVGLRLRYRGERVSPWLEAGAAFWPRSHTLYVLGSAASTDLPANEGFLGVGLSLGQNR